MDMLKILKICNRNNFRSTTVKMEIDDISISTFQEFCYRAVKIRHRSRRPQCNFQCHNVNKLSMILIFRFSQIKKCLLDNFYIQDKRSAP